MYSLLLIDDEYFVRKGLKETIDWTRYDIEVVGEAEDGEEGLTLAMKLNPDIIITDIYMPNMNGISFITELRNKGLQSEVIILSGYGEFIHAQSAISQGVVAYILKPPNNDEFDHAIRLCIERTKKKQQKTTGEIEFKDRLPVLTPDILPEYAEKVKSNQLVRNTAVYICENYHRNITAKGLSDYFLVSPSGLMHTFKQVCGITLNTYITLIRIEAAKIMLNTGHYKIYEVAYMIGYKNTKYFRKIFKSVTGYIPTDFPGKR